MVGAKRLGGEEGAQVSPSSRPLLTPLPPPPLPAPTPRYSHPPAPMVCIPRLETKEISNINLQGLPGTSGSAPYRLGQL